MNRSNYFIKHKRNYFAGDALSSSCHRGNPSMNSTLIPKRTVTTVKMKIQMLLSMKESSRLNLRMRYPRRWNINKTITPCQRC